MVVETIDKKSCKVFRIRQGTFVDGDLNEIRDIVADHLRRGARKVALSFNDEAYPYSKLISLIVKCDSLAKKTNSELVIIQPNADFADVLAGTNLTAIVKLLASENDL
ncbi:MAG: hypothetical protein GF350_05975 [Chitinivibrionales bacterium]|nr:hypothetical protein [Chitinivibrionales bacterium]